MTMNLFETMSDTTKQVAEMLNAKTDNELIAEFIGGKYLPNGIYSEWRFPDNSRHSTLLYDKSWDWLMPVVQKIGQHLNDTYGIEAEVAITSHLTCIQIPLRAKVKAMSIFKWTASTGCFEIKDAYRAAVEFIKWYNKHKQS